MNVLFRIFQKRPVLSQSEDKSFSLNVIFNSGTKVCPPSLSEDSDGLKITNYAFTLPDIFLMRSACNSLIYNGLRNKIAMCFCLIQINCSTSSNVCDLCFVSTFTYCATLASIIETFYATMELAVVAAGFSDLNIALIYFNDYLFQFSRVPDLLSIRADNFL